MATKATKDGLRESLKAGFTAVPGSQLWAARHNMVIDETPAQRTAAYKKGENAILRLAETIWYAAPTYAEDGYLGPNVYPSNHPSP